MSRMRSPVTSRSNWAKESSTFSVSRPMLVVVLNAWVTLTNDTPSRSKPLDDLGEVRQRAGQPVDLVDDHDIDLARLDIREERLQRRTIDDCRPNSRHRHSARAELQPSPAWRRM